MNFRNKTLEIQRSQDLMYTTPTRRCLICGEVENPKAGIVNEAIAWLCPECKSRARRVLYPKEGE